MRAVGVVEGGEAQDRPLAGHGVQPHAASRDYQPGRLRPPLEDSTAQQLIVSSSV